MSAPRTERGASEHIRQHTYTYVHIRQHTSAYLRLKRRCSTHSNDTHTHSSCASANSHTRRYPLCIRRCSSSLPPPRQPPAPPNSSSYTSAHSCPLHMLLRMFLLPPPASACTKETATESASASAHCLRSSSQQPRHPAHEALSCYCMRHSATSV